MAGVPGVLRGVSWGMEDAASGNSSREGWPVFPHLPEDWLVSPCSFAQGLGHPRSCLEAAWGGRQLGRFVVDASPDKHLECKLCWAAGGVPVNLVLEPRNYSDPLS